MAIGRSGNFRRLGVPGESREHVFNRLHDPRDFRGRRVCVVGGGDSAVETACALAEQGADVTLSYRGEALSRPKPANLERLEGIGASGGTRILLSTRVERIDDKELVIVHADGRRETIHGDAVFTMIGREPPLDFLRRSGIRIRGEWTAVRWAGLAASLALFTFLYNWKSDGDVGREFFERNWFPWNLPDLIDRFGTTAAILARDPSTFLGTMAITLAEPGFWFSLAYSLAVVIFGIRRIRRRRTPYIAIQTITLMLIQVIPLFLLPYIALPWAGHNGLFDGGTAGAVADALFPESGYGHGREYWRSVGLILAWPLFIWNVFTWQPMTAWLVISLVQTFVLIPLIIYYWGKGAYCGWICTCGALAETLGDDHRHKMPHGPAWNRLNMVGQVILALAFLLLGLRVAAWVAPAGAFAASIERLYEALLFGWQPFGIRLNYKWTVDLFLSGIIGVGTYFWLSGRVWCRFACPLAALMHIYARFSRFRILADKKKCISCNVCTSVCHQGIDVMNFANKGLPMADPECVRCSACVQQCPTGTLSFGQVDPATGAVLRRDRVAASPLAAADP